MDRLVEAHRHGAGDVTDKQLEPISPTATASGRGAQYHNQNVILARRRSRAKLFAPPGRTARTGAQLPSNVGLLTDHPLPREVVLSPPGQRQVDPDQPPSLPRTIHSTSANDPNTWKHERLRLSAHAYISGRQERCGVHHSWCLRRETPARQTSPVLSPRLDADVIDKIIQWSCGTPVWRKNLHRHLLRRIGTNVWASAAARKRIIMTARWSTPRHCSGDAIPQRTSSDDVIIRSWACGSSTSRFCAAVRRPGVWLDVIEEPVRMPQRLPRQVPGGSR